MAERRMFAKTIVTSDAFLDMPISARCLYFALGMEADDDGFVNKPNAVMRLCGSTLDDMNVLISKKFVIAFEDGVIVIKHWRINNYIQKDRYNETKYMDHRECLKLDENNAYVIDIETHPKEEIAPMYTECIQPVSNTDTQVRLGKSKVNNIVPKGTLVQNESVSNAEFEVVEDEELDDLFNSIPKKETKSLLPKTQQSRFNKFWEMYPKKVGKQSAEKAWKKINPSEEETNNILLGLKRSIEKDSRFREQQFTPMPASWLNAGSWEDEFQDELPDHIEYKAKPTQPAKEGSFDAEEFLQSAIRRTLEKHENK